MSNSIANNPLAKHFRQPSIYLKLPSGGNFYPEDSLETSVTGEIPIYPMTVKDEIAIKTPDALMNGDAVAGLIASCCPSIKEPWAMPLIDVDPILIAIRLASYGNSMDIISDCPHCQANNEHTIDLRKLLDQIPSVTGYNKATAINSLVFELQPQTFKDLNRLQQISFEQQKIINVILDSDLSEEDKKVHFQESFDNLTDLNLSSLVSCIKSITTSEDIRVTQPALIKDFLGNTDRITYDAIKSLVEQVIKDNSVPPVDLQCNECEKPYTTKVEFNQSNFFG